MRTVQQVLEKAQGIIEAMDSQNVDMEMLEGFIEMCLEKGIPSDDILDEVRLVAAQQLIGAHFYSSEAQEVLLPAFGFGQHS